jgi:hypothetical protein
VSMNRVPGPSDFGVSGASPPSAPRNSRVFSFRSSHRVVSSEDLVRSWKIKLDIETFDFAEKF